MAGRKVRILVSDTGRGLWRDAGVVAGIVEEAGFEAELVICPPRHETLIRWIRYIDRFKWRLPVLLQKPINRLQRLVYRSLDINGVFLTIHLQTVFSRYLAASRYNWLIPNLEWYSIERIQYLFLVDRILCKTRDAFECFVTRHDGAVFVGFSGQIPSCTGDAVERDFRRFLHVAGNNRKKGTAAVVGAWSQHPEWPLLDLVIEDRNRLPVIPENVRIHERISDAGLKLLRRTCGIAVAPSEAEGFGHSLFDAMAFGQVIVTIDAPPMNELVNTERGFLVSWKYSKPCRLGTQYFVDQTRLEAAVDQILAMETEALKEMSCAARSWVDSNDKDFRRQMISQLNLLSEEK